MFNDYFMPELSEKERLKMLTDNADAIETTTFYRDLTDDEVVERTRKVTSNVIALSRLEDEKKVATREFKEAMDPLKRENTDLLTEVKTRKKEISGRLYHFNDLESGYRKSYDEKGELIETRKLLPSERQETVLTVARAAAK